MPKERLSIELTLRLTPTMHTQLAELADAEGLSTASLIRRIVALYLRQQAHPTPAEHPSG